MVVPCRCGRPDCTICEAWFRIETENLALPVRMRTLVLLSLLGVAFLWGMVAYVINLAPTSVP